MDAAGRVTRFVETPRPGENEGDLASAGVHVVDPSVLAGIFAARGLGALGGKVAGSGGSGFLVLLCPEASQAAVTEAMEAMGLPPMEFGFDCRGAKILLNTVPRNRSWFGQDTRRNRAATGPGARSADVLGIGVGAPPRGALGSFQDRGSHSELPLQTRCREGLLRLH